MASSTNSTDNGISSQRSSWPRSVGLRLLIDLVEQVAHAAHRADVDAERLETPAHAMHVHLDGVAADVLAEAEELIHDLLLAHDLALPREQELRQSQLAGRHLDRLVVVEQAPR